MRRVRQREIPTLLYRRIVECMPIPCVDVVITNRGAFLLGKRRNKPARGQWFLLGGRILKGERLEAAARRKAREEAGFARVRIKRFLAVRETMFNESALGPPYHSVTVVFLLSVPSGKFRTHDGQHSELRWFNKVDPRWHPYVREMLTLAGFR